MHMQGLDRQDAGSPLGIMGMTGVRVGKTCKVESVGCFQGRLSSTGSRVRGGHVSYSIYLPSIPSNQDSVFCFDIKSTLVT